MGTSRLGALFRVLRIFFVGFLHGGFCMGFVDIGLCLRDFMVLGLQEGFIYGFTATLQGSVGL